MSRQHRKEITKNYDENIYTNRTSNDHQGNKNSKTPEDRNDLEFKKITTKIERGRTPGGLSTTNLYPGRKNRLAIDRTNRYQDYIVALATNATQSIFQAGKLPSGDKLQADQ